MGSWTDKWAGHAPEDQEPEEEDKRQPWTDRYSPKPRPSTPPAARAAPQPTPKLKPETPEEQEARLGPVLYPLKRAGQQLGKFAGHMYALAGDPSQLYEERVVRPLGEKLAARPPGQEETWPAMVGRNIYQGAFTGSCAPRCA
jgi:hypothetical protein